MNHKSQHIVLFGGSFNPPHLGHTIVISQAFELIPSLDELWLLPCNRHTFGKHVDFAPASDRLAMSRLLINNLPSTIHNRIKLCPIEIDLNLPGQTLNTLHALKKETAYLSKTMSISSAHYSLLSTHYSFLMGSDQLPSFEKWGSWQQLIKELPFFIYPRSGFPFKPVYPNMTTLESPLQAITNISSTIIRNRLKTHLPISHLVPPSIADYISSHHLYQKA